MGRFVLFLQVFGLVVLVTTFLQINCHLVSDCSHCCRFACSWPTPYDQCKQLPLILPDILVYFTRFFLFEVIQEAIGLFADLVFVLEECIQPIFDLVASFDIKKLGRISGSVFAAPHGVRVGLYILLNDVPHYFS